MSPRLAKILRYTGYGVFALFVTLISTYLAFPFGRLKDTVAEALSQDGRYDVTVGSVSGLFPLGLALEDIRLVGRPERPGDKPDKLTVDKAEIRIGLFSLLSGSPKISFAVDAFKGHIEGTTMKNDKERAISFKFHHVAFKHLPGIAKAIDLPMAGTVSGDASLTIPKRDGLRKAEGHLRISCSNCSFGDGKHKIKPKFMARPGKYNPVAEQGVTLPKIRLGKFGGDIEIKKGRAEFKDFEALSPDGEAELMGYVLLRDPVSFSSVQALFKFRFSDELKQKKPKIVGIEASMARGRRRDGMLGMCITGRLKRLRFRPCKSSPVEFGRRGGGRDRRRRGGRDRKHGNRRWRPRPPSRRGPVGSAKGPDY